MMKLNKRELKIIMYNFNCRANRLINASHMQVESSLRMFIDYIESIPIINEYINMCKRDKFNVEDEITEVYESYGRCIFDLGITVDEEVYSVYTVLKYILENNCDITTLGMGYSSSNKYRDIVKEFNHGVSLILIQHIESYLRQIVIEMGYDEEVAYMITVNGGQVNISKDNSIINATQNNNASDSNGLIELISGVKGLIDNTIPEEEKELIVDNVDMIQEQLESDNPKKGVIKSCLGGLSEAVLKIPHAIILCENIEKLSTYVLDKIKK